MFFSPELTTRISVDDRHREHPSGVITLLVQGKDQQSDRDQKDIERLNRYRSHWIVWRVPDTLVRPVHIKAGQGGLEGQ